MSGIFSNTQSIVSLNQFMSFFTFKSSISSRDIVCSDVKKGERRVKFFLKLCFFFIYVSEVAQI